MLFQLLFYIPLIFGIVFRFASTNYAWNTQFVLPYFMIAANIAVAAAGILVILFVWNIFTRDTKTNRRQFLQLVITVASLSYSFRNENECVLGFEPQNYSDCIDSVKEERNAEIATCLKNNGVWMRSWIYPAWHCGNKVAKKTKN